MESLKKEILTNAELYIKENHKKENISDFIIKTNEIDGMTNKNFHISMVFHERYQNHYL